MVVNNNKELREPLITDISETLHVDNVNSRDYKDVLTEIREQQGTEKVKSFLRIIRMDCDNKGDMVRKAIASMLFFNISPDWIMRLLKRKKTVFYKYVQGKK
jgi:hypothetical protein